MALKGETLHLGASPICPGCGKIAKMGVYHSAAGFYIGSYCRCGPYTRESLYYWKDIREAMHAFNTGEWERR